jgi:hypothetical protein
MTFGVIFERLGLLYLVHAGGSDDDFCSVAVIYIPVSRPFLIRARKIA